MGVIFVSWIRVLRGVLRKVILHLRAPPLSAPFLIFFNFQLPAHFFSPLTPLPCLLKPFSVRRPPPPRPLKAERKWGKRERARGESERGEGGGPRYGSDRVSALSEAFHHIFVAVCTPALQNPHSKLLLLRFILPNVGLLQLILIVLQPQQHT